MRAVVGTSRSSLTLNKSEHKVQYSSENIIHILVNGFIHHISLSEQEKEWQTFQWSVTEQQIQWAVCILTGRSQTVRREGDRLEHKGKSLTIVRTFHKQEGKYRSLTCSICCSRHISRSLKLSKVKEVIWKKLVKISPLQCKSFVIYTIIQLKYQNMNNCGTFLKSKYGNESLTTL